MVLCTDLEVVTDAPTATVTDVTFVSHDEDDRCVEFDNCEQTIGNVQDDYVSMRATVTIANADAKFKIKIDFQKDGVDKSLTTTQITQSVGEVIYCITTSNLYVVADYTSLTMVIIDLVAA